MSAKEKVVSFAFRILRLAGVLALIYICMVFYLALTERQNAYPRAIAHKEAREAIEKTAKSISCTLSDGTVLEGWVLGDPEGGVYLYYPDADEDGAQFLAELGNPPQGAFVTFNYRGSGTNKGKPSGETFEQDAGEIFQCASQVNGLQPQAFIGRGTGAILASRHFNGQGKLVLIDPVSSIAEAVSEKYRALYPSFLVRARSEMSEEALTRNQNRVIFLSDRAKNLSRIHNFQSRFPEIYTILRNGETLGTVLLKCINKEN